MKKNVYVVFCMDTEGPCDDPSNPSLLKNWDAINIAMDKLFNRDFRFKFKDSYNNNFKIGWFFLNWTGFIENPRNRDFGYHKVRDHYFERYGDLINLYGDEDCWHYHHPAKSKVGNEWGLDWSENYEYENIISKQILERSHFPVTFRAGGTIESNQSSRWLDSWFPFDYSNRSPLKINGIIDWSSAPSDWSVYRPSPDNFSEIGSGRRYIARTLDLDTDLYKIDESEIRKAFHNANEGNDVILSVFDHDYRDIAERVENYLSIISKVASSFPEVKFKYSSPKNAIIHSLNIDLFPSSLKVEAAIFKGNLRVWSTSPIFQSHPWICIECSNGEVIQLKKGIVQDSNTSWEIDLRAYENFKKIGIAISTINGLSDVLIINENENGFDNFIKKGIVDCHPVYPNSLHEHSVLYPKLCFDRISGLLPEMDCSIQLVNIIQNLNYKITNMLDAGCASGQVYFSVKELGIDYYGIDAFQRAIELGKLVIGSRVAKKNQLRNISLFNLNPKENYDLVLSMFYFRYNSSFEKELEIMARASNKYLIVRAPSFGNEFVNRYIPDVLLEKSFQTMRYHFNIFEKNWEIQH